MTYEYGWGDRVRHRYSGKTGTVDTCVPGNGSFPWYFVNWDDGSTDRHTSDELEGAS